MSKQLARLILWEQWYGFEWGCVFMSAASLSWAKPIPWVMLCLSGAAGIVMAGGSVWARSRYDAGN